MSILVLCKFTPLGFETKVYPNGYINGVKCKFTPLGFETRWVQMEPLQVLSV